jgi:hypothetical protein
VAFDQDVGVGQVDRALLVVASHFRAEKERTLGADPELEKGQEPRVVAIEPLLAAGEGVDVAEPVEHHEGVVLFEHASRHFGVCRRDNGVLLGLVDPDLHGCLRVHRSAGAHPAR